MSTLSADHLSANSLPLYLAVSKVEEFVIRTTSTSIQLTLDVLSANVTGKLAVLTLWRAADLLGKVYPPPAPAAALRTQTFPLAAGRQAHTFELPLSDYPDLQGPSAQQVTLMLSCPSAKTITSSGPFTLAPVNTCDLGLGLPGVFKTRSPEKPYPQYSGDLEFTPELFKNWAPLLQQGLIDPIERVIITAVGRTEAHLDGVQSWDNQVVSVGCFQKTLSVDGKGELPAQLWQFKQEEPQRFACALTNAQGSGWDVDSKKHVTYTDTNGTVYSAARNNLDDLRTKIHELHDKDKKSPQKNRILDPLVRLGRDEAFQKRQLLDATKRLRDLLKSFPYGIDTRDPKKPYYSENPKYRWGCTAGNYLQGKTIDSYVGWAFLLDHHVNRKGQPMYYLGAALTQFFEVLPWGKGTLPAKPDRDPDNWRPELRNRYERELIKLYAQSMEDYMDIFNEEKPNAQRGVTQAAKGDPSRYSIIRNFFAEKGYEMSWLPATPRPRIEPPVKKKK